MQTSRAYSSNEDTIRMDPDLIGTCVLPGKQERLTDRITICIIHHKETGATQMPGWLPRILNSIHELAVKREVRFTLKALREVAGLGLGLDPMDVCDVLAHLSSEDSAGRLRSELTGEWLYIFKPQIASTVLYVKLILRSGCLIMSFHEDESHDDDAHA
jgi:hypothetical protein